MRITREIADAVAKKATEKRELERQKNQEEVKIFIYEAIRATIPVEAFNQYLVDKGFIVKRTSFNITDGAGRYCSGIQSKHELPFTPNQSVVLRPEIYKEIVDLRQSIDNMKISISRDKRKISDALVQLRTRANAIKHIPELEQFFPEEVTTAIVPTFSNIRELLK